jgi:hypothetical protein
MSQIPPGARARQAAALVVALARANGIALGEIEDQAAVLLGTFAVSNPDHPVTDYFDRADDGEIEEFLHAVSRELRPTLRGPMHTVGPVSLN